MLVPPNTYTDEPRLNPNPILASLQLVSWLFIHPAAWNSYVRRLDDRLPSDFCLASLTRAQWRNPELKRLVLTSLLAHPIWVGLILIVLLLGIHQGGGAAWADIVTGVGASLAAGAVTSISLSVSAGIIVSLVGGMLAGLIGGVLGGIGIPAGEFLSLEASVPADIVSDWGRSVGIGLVAGLVAWSIPHLAIDKHMRYSLRRQIGGFSVGVFISLLVVILATGLSVLAGWEQAISFTLGNSAPGLEVGIAASRTFGLAISLAWGIAVWLRTHEWARALALAAVFVMAQTVAFMLMGATMPSKTGGIFLGVTAGLLFPAIFIAPCIVAERLAGVWAGAAAGAMGSGGIYAVALISFGEHSIVPVLPLTIAGILVGISFGWWRAYLTYPFQAAWNSVLYTTEKRRVPGQPSLLRLHAAFWDELQRLPFYGLDNYLVMVAERNPDEGEAAIEHLRDGHQRWAVRKARFELEARWLARCSDLPAMADAHRHLLSGEQAGPVSPVLHRFNQISRDVAAALNQASLYNQRLALRGVENHLNRMLRDLEVSHNESTARFEGAAVQWCRLVSEKITSLEQEALDSQELENPYVFGVPLTENQEVFVGRGDISAKLEGMLRDKHGSPLLLYGQRRMGKTSLLHNLGRLLPSNVVLLYVDCQGAAAAADYSDFLFALVRQMSRSAQRYRDVSLPAIDRHRLDKSPFLVFDEWLEESEQLFLEGGRERALLALDEFEALDSVSDKGRFDEKDFLAMLRHLIQHRPRLKVLLSGSHTFDEFSQWADYLINVQLVHVGFLSEVETRQLVENPVRDFSLRYTPNATNRVYSLTRGHPHLVQQLCYEIVTLKNEQDPLNRMVARRVDVEAAISPALEHGSFFFSDIEHNQIGDLGRALLTAIAKRGEGINTGRRDLENELGIGIDEALSNLIHRELIEEGGEGYSFQVELIRRWFDR